MNSANKMQVAETILEQIGPRACAMLGAHQFMGDAQSLTFAIKGSPKKVSKIVITLDTNDTYTMAFWKGRGIHMECLSETSFVYADQIRLTIESHTGLRTSL